MQVFQTWGVPPRRGKIILPIMGCRTKSKKALPNKVTANNGKVMWLRKQGSFLAYGYHESVAGSGGAVPQSELVP